MKKLLALILLLPIAAFAASPFDGTWVTKIDSVKMSDKPNVLLLDKGVFKCSNCVPPIEVKADGADHAVTGHAYYDTVAVRVAGPNSVQVVRKQAGKPTLSSDYAISADGKSLTDKFTDQTGKETANAETTFTRVAAGPAGSHALSGSWRADKLQNASANWITVTYKSAPGGFAMSAPTGQSYEAKFDGKEYLTAGDPGHTMVSLKSVDAHTVIETDKRLGKVTDVIRMTVSADGKSMQVVDEDKEAGMDASWTMEKKH